MNCIKQYYRLSSIKDKSKQLVSIINQLDKTSIETIFTKKSVDLFLVEKDSIYKIKETIIGANENKYYIKNKLPILIF